jgi:AcrR family transcriptional regulator
MTSPPAPPTDRRVRRTHKQLRNALVGLVLERGWDAVSVKDVCERADIGRSTFYVHFADKEELLVSGFDDLHRELEVARRGGQHPFAFASGLVEHARANNRMFRALLGTRSSQVVQRRFREVLTHVIEAELAASGVDERARRWVARYICGGFVEMLLVWLERPSALDSAVLVELFERLTRGALKNTSARR